MGLRICAAHLCVGLVLSALPAVAFAQDDEGGLQPEQAIGTEVFASTDSDDTDILRVALDFDIRNAGEDKRIGVRVEKAWYDPQDTGTRERERVFMRYADQSGGWTYSALIGTDGDSVIGSAYAYDDSRFRKEFFVERDVVETRRGIDEGIYSTFAGAAIDLPADENNIVTLLGGVQDFTGDNVRLHARANYVHVVDSDLGFSVQLRGRYFNDSDPGEFDYYSPDWYAQVLPVVQLRRFVDGWELVGVGGIGVQRDNFTDWRQSNYAQLRFRSPRNDRDWSAFGEVTYTDTPGASATVSDGYDYLQGRVGVYRRF